jgi:hypothetical protein
MGGRAGWKADIPSFCGAKPTQKVCWTRAAARLLLQAPNYQFSGEAANGCGEFGAAPVMSVRIPAIATTCSKQIATIGTSGFNCLLINS